MPRTEARIHTSIWTDDFRALPADAQWLYFALLAQDDLTLCGVMPYRPARWAKLANGLTAAKVAKLIAHLERARYVVVDRDAGELLIRTFMRHDGVITSPLVLKGAARSVEAVDSPVVLDTITAELPAHLRDGWPAWYREADKKAIADRLTVNGSTKPLRKAPPEPPTETPSERGYEPPSSVLRPPSSTESSSSENSSSAPPEPDDDLRAAVIDAIATDRITAAGGKPEHPGYRRAVIDSIETQLGDHVTELVTHQPDRTPHELAALADADRHRTTNGTPPPGPRPDGSIFVPGTGWIR